ncbi:polysaccharide deacetylase family protein [Paludibaculum fermentans]|uniref:Polysaccharide deacetylase family protein n=1 Tax=Paludibaculum fermentans TaxID=1473598 RepID=A0A7S7SIC5_PALFE|nr:polysaccharide deacetylase family protein [Paludibaculum fermentans]QOY85929.1 polysaccharide deacetylase family protein [Paludibaculum fermentans]
MQRRSFLSLAAASAASSALPSLSAQTGEKRLIVHADDAGMCHSVNMATVEALTKGSVSSASIMMPCPWVSEFAAWAKANPKMDLGLHLTLTSEWKYYRWRPVAPIDQVKGLIDPEGYIWRDVRNAATHATPAEVETELRAQVIRAKEYGIQFTHVDTHMGTLFARPDFFEVYTKVAKEFNVPCMLPRPTPEAEKEMKEYPITVDMLNKKAAAGYKMLDRLVTGVPGKGWEERTASYRKLIAELKPGVTKLIIHLAKDDAEIRAVTGAWEYRWEDFRFWTSQEAKDLLAKHNVRLFTYRELAG